MAMSGDPEETRTAEGLSAIVAGLLEDASVLAARTRTTADVEALRLAISDVTGLVAALAVLVRPRP